MNKTHQRLLEITGHLEAMRENKILGIQGTLLRFYAEEIKDAYMDVGGRVPIVGAFRRCRSNYRTVG